MFQENVFIKRNLKWEYMRKGSFTWGKEKEKKWGGANFRKSWSSLKFEFSIVCITASWTNFITRLSFAVFLGIHIFCRPPHKNEILEGVPCVWLVKEAVVCRLVASLAKEFVWWKQEKIARREGIHCIVKAGLQDHLELGGVQQLFCWRLRKLHF